MKSFDSIVFATLAIVVAKALYIHQPDCSILNLPHPRMIEGTKYLDSLEELFTLQDTADFYGNR